MSVQLHDESGRAEPVLVDCTVSVSRDGDGDLVDAVRDRLASVDGVDAVEELELAGLRPGLNDLTVEVAAELRMAADADPVRRLEACFGVRDVALRGRAEPPD